MSHLTDDQLLQRFGESRDAEAFDRLVGRHMGLVHATCRRETGDDALAEDAAQATFLVLARKAKSLRDERSLASWLFATARLTARNLLREERRRKAREAKAVGTERTMNPEEPEAIEPLLNAALGRLKPQDRQAVILRYLEGRSLAEVATELNVAEDAARMRVQRAVERLRLNLGRMGVATSVAALLTVLDTQASAAVPPRLLAVSAPPVASSGAGLGAWTLLAKGTALLLATTTTTKALVASGVALVAAGGFVFVKTRPAIDEATARAAFRPFVGTWKGTSLMPMPPNGARKPTTMILVCKPEKDGLGLSFTMRFPDIHQAERKHLSFDPRGQFVVEAQGQPIERYNTVGLQEFVKKGAGKLGFEGRSTEGGRTADLKVSFDVQGDRMVMHQSAKPLNGPEQGQDVTLERVK